MEDGGDGVNARDEERGIEGETEGGRDGGNLRDGGREKWR